MLVLLKFVTRCYRVTGAHEKKKGKYIFGGFYTLSGQVGYMM